MEKTWFNHSVLQAVTQIRGALFITWPNSSCLFLQLTVLSFFYKEGEYLYDIGCEGSGDQQFSHPTGLAFDKFNHLIVCITENRGIFTLGGKCVAELAGDLLRVVVLLLCFMWNWTIVCYWCGKTLYSGIQLELTWGNTFWAKTFYNWRS